MNRDDTIKSLEATLSRLFQKVKLTQEYHAHIVKTFDTRYGMNIADLYKETENFYQQHVVSRYSGPRSSGYKHVSAEAIRLEENIWLFAESNPEAWYILIEKLINSDSCADVNTLDGFSFMDTFIHNGVYDDWCISIAQRDKQTVFFNTDIEADYQLYKSNGYKITHLSPKTVVNALGLAEIA